MRNAVIIIHRSIERIDHPLKFARLIADDSFFAVECVLRKFFEQRLRDQFLRADVDFEFDVVLGGLINLHWFLEVVPQHFAGGASRFNGGVEIMGHERLARTKNTKCTTKTNRRGNRPYLNLLPGRGGHSSRVSGGSAPETVREAPGQGSLSRLPYMTASQEKNGRRNRILPPG